MRITPVASWRTAVWVAVALLLAGCPARSELVSARFIDENRDGKPDPDETIVLTFSRPVHLDPAPARRGVHVRPEGHSLGVYELEPGSNPYQLVVHLGQGTLKLRPDGFFGKREFPEATGLSLDYGMLEALYDRESGARLRGVSPIVDLARNPHPPARLEGAEWVDVDRNHSISRGDRVRLRFNRRVTISQEVRKRNGQIPQDLFILPVAGDTFDGGDESARLILDDGEIVVVLGTRPQLSPHGTFDPLAVNLAGNPSGIAIDGTNIRPHPAIVDDFGVGVTSHRAIDVRGRSLEPFRPAPSFLDSGQTLSGHTATLLPNRRILVTGGIVSVRGQPPVPSDAVWVCDVDAGEWKRVGSLKFPRWGHSATYLPGSDLTYETGDDFVFIVGGCDGTKAVRQAEIILVPLRVEESYIIEPVSNFQLRARFEHSAHRVGESNRVILIGGQVDLQRNLEPEVEELRVTVPPDVPRRGSTRIEVRSLGRLRTPRVFHQAVLYPVESPQVILVFGGLGAGRGSPSVFSGQALEAPEVVWFAGEPLEAPELIWIQEPSRSTELIVENAHLSPGRRRGHRMIALLEDEWPFLIVGGTSTPLLGTPGPDHCDGAYRATLDFESDPLNPRIRFRRAGTLTRHVYNLGAQLLLTGEVLILGGAEGEVPSRHVQLFNPRTDHFETFCRPLLSPHESPRIVGLAAGNRWFIIGGRGAEESSARPSVEEFVWLE